MKKPASSTRIIVLPTVAPVLWREGSTGQFSNASPYKDFDQADHTKRFEVKLGADAECEFHRQVAGGPTPPQQDSKETLCLRVTTKGGKIDKVKVFSRPKLRKAGKETTPGLHTQKRVVKFTKKGYRLLYSIHDKGDKGNKNPKFRIEVIVG